MISYSCSDGKIAVPLCGLTVVLQGLFHWHFGNLQKFLQTNSPSEVGLRRQCCICLQHIMLSVVLTTKAKFNKSIISIIFSCYQSSPKLDYAVLMVMK